MIRSGQPFGHHDAAPDDRYWQRYIRGQHELARLSAREVARKLRLPRNSHSLLDIGGGHGWYAAELCRRHPRLTATVLDLPGSAAIGRQIIAEAGMTERVRHRDANVTTVQLGDIFDCVICFNLIHHLAQDDIVGLFAKVHDALEKGGSFAVMDAFAEPSYRKSAAANFLAMFVYLSSGAQVYTPAQLRGWFREAGFSPPRRLSILRIPGQAMYVAKKTG